MLGHFSVGSASAAIATLVSSPLHYCFLATADSSSLEFMIVRTRRVNLKGRSQEVLGTNQTGAEMQGSHMKHLVELFRATTPVEHLEKELRSVGVSHFDRIAMAFSVAL